MADKAEEIAEAPEPEESERCEFPCESCGARMQWDPDADALSCEFCGHRVVVPREEGTIVERSLAEAGESIRGFGIDVRVAVCGTCGARVSFEQSATSQNCLYCGSSSVLAQEANRNAVRPESLVPLDLGRGEVDASFRKWLHGLWFRPSDLKRAQTSSAVGLYVPFWAFSCSAHSKWSADSGTYYYVTQTYTVVVNGRPKLQTRQVRKVRWRPAWGERDDRYANLLICASQGVTSGRVDELGPFDAGKLVSYRPEYLAGWHAEEYSIDLEQGWQRGEARVVESQRERCARDIPGDTYRNLRVKNHIFDVRWKHILLPIWSLQYRYKSKIYTVLINGQNGKVAGDAPYSAYKIAALVLAILVAGAIAAAIWAR